MAKFIEVTHKIYGDKILINTENIIGVVDYGNDGRYLIDYEDRKQTKGFYVAESFDELRQKLLGE